MVLGHMVLEHMFWEHMVLEHMVLEHMALGHMVLEHMVLEHMVLEHMVLGHMVLEHMVLGHTIETYGRRPHNRQTTAFCHAWPILLFVSQTAFIPLLMYYLNISVCIHTICMHVCMHITDYFMYARTET